MHVRKIDSPKKIIKILQEAARGRILGFKKTTTFGMGKESITQYKPNDGSGKNSKQLTVIY
jgi:hypothetical protein